MNNMAEEKENRLHTLWLEAKDYIRLNLDYAKLTTAEKLTMLLVAVSLCLIGFVLVSLIVFFLSMAVVRWIAQATGITWAYFIMSGFYLLVLVLAFALRKTLIVNPISRFVSKLFF